MLDHFIAKNATAHKENSYYTLAISYYTFCVGEYTILGRGIITTNLNGSRLTYAVDDYFGISSTQFLCTLYTFFFASNENDPLTESNSQYIL